MLRYDGLYPETEQDSILADSPGEDREINLTGWQNHRHWSPTEGRWKSFGWEVIDSKLL
jgi:hypothetical protein